MCSQSEQILLGVLMACEFNSWLDCAAIAVVGAASRPNLTKQTSFSPSPVSSTLIHMQCEDELVQAIALSVMPMEQLHAEAAEAVEVSSAMGEEPIVALQDALAEAVLAWFKLSFFSWVRCGEGRIIANMPAGQCSSASHAPEGLFKGKLSCPGMSAEQVRHDEPWTYQRGACMRALS